MNVTALTSAIRRQTNVSSATGDLPDADILDIINEGVSIVSSMHRWPFLESSATIDVTQDVAFYPFDSVNFGQIRTIVRTDNSYTLKSIGFDEYLYRVGDNAPSSSNGTHFALTGENIYIYPTPSTTQTQAYIVYFWLIPTPLTASGEPEWATQFHHILIDYGAYRVHEREEYFEESRDAYARFTRGLKDMIRWYNSRTTEYPMIYGDGPGRAWDERLHLNIW